MEIRVVLRTLLRDYTISPSNARDEGWQSRGVALAPSRGALVRPAPRRYRLEPVTSRSPRSIPIGDRAVGRTPRARTVAST